MIPFVLLRSSWSVISNTKFLVSLSSKLISVILISYSLISVPFKTVNILALPFFISFGLATLYVLLFLIFDVYSPNIPCLVFSETVPLVFDLSYSILNFLYTHYNVFY